MKTVKCFIFIIVLMLAGCDKRITEGHIIEKKVENDKFIMISQNGTRLFISPEMQ